ncbi:methyltransferase domain-containing protein [Kribbella sp. NPDC000426]|uniref:methyltransferase domain-containing protein n=1 Tax=Kribbella sp. NPDC000426 TaxID=3154255 RepID=UPI00332F28EB
MTDDNAAGDWTSLAEAMVEAIKRAGYLHRAPLELAFRETPRHLFVPEFFRLKPNAEGFSAIDGVVRADDPDWLATVYSNEALITQVKPIAGQTGATAFTSSSSAPALMADMIDELRIDRGMNVLEVGTGTGYNAAILCHLLGDRAVTTIDIDPELTERARERLAALGYRPSFEPADDSHDRILATHAVAEVPPEWIRWSRPGAVILADFRAPANSNIGAWLKLVVDQDGATATGTLMDPRGYFMNARKVPEFAYAGEPAPEFTDEEHRQRAQQTERRRTALRSGVLDLPDFALYLWLTAPGLAFAMTPDGDASLNGPRAESWAYVADGTVYYGGAEDLWAVVEHAYRVWEWCRRPPKETWTLKVSARGTTSVHLPGEDGSVRAG